MSLFQKKSVDPITIGEHSYGRPAIGNWTNQYKVTVGKYCSISDNVFISLDGDHPTDWVTTYPLSKKILGKDKIGSPRGKGDVVIGNDVWIGGGALIMGGVRIGNGAVVGARSVVTKNVDDYEIVAGNPARHIRYRFDPLIVDQLKRVKWWDWPLDRVKNLSWLLESDNVKDFLDVALYRTLKEQREGDRILTFFTVPKPFMGRIKTIQMNALQSWKQLGLGETILCGNEKGTSEAAAFVGAQHIPNIECNEYGTPLMSDVIKKADQHANTDYLCYINADIILTDSFRTTLENIFYSGIREGLITGRRMNTPLGGPIDYSLGWQEWLTAYANGFGELSRPDSMDYFVYPKGYWKVYPPFAAGRPRFDNWMIREAKRRGTPIIDATGKILAVHQNHDYGHIPGNSDSRKVEGPEVKGNIRLYGEHTPCYTTLDADYKLTDGGLTRSYNMIAFKHDVRRLLKI